ncbi:unnamed protein product [Dovyalis caffra]|uniref:RRM domain-containing protein n=1 Tax=Dovyalis caffra TaxID=77055 RepID=A0AAV1R8L8_9ROSI|nr:unnamed protein product [Dovyalis caffra]
MSEWESRLWLINDVLDEADQKPDTNQAMKNWLSKLRDLAYDVEDILDECQTEALKRKLKGAKSQASTSTVQPSAALPNGPKLQGIGARWEDIMKERSDLGLDINVTRRSNKANPRVQTTSLVKEPKSVSGEICYHLDAKKSSGATSYAKVRHLSLIFHRYGTSQRFEAVYEMESLRTLLAIRSSSFGGLTYLSNKQLSIERMSNLKGMAVDNFPSLETLYIGDMLEWEQWYWSNGLNEDPGGKFPKLVELTLRNCDKLIGKLPGCLPFLKKLHISGCRQLTNLPEMLPSLCELTVKDCDEVIFRMKPNFSSLTTLEISGISGLVGLHEPFVEALVALEDLEIERCRELKYLWQDGVDLSKLANLKSLKIFECEQLVSLVKGAKGIFPYTLKSFQMGGCHSMESLPDGMMTVMSSNNSNQCLLEELVIQDCPSLKSLPRGKLPTTLKKLEVEGCKELESEYRFLEGIMRCDAHLEYLRVSKFSITSFPTGKFPTPLNTLKFDGCRRIQSLPSLLNLSHLTKLIIRCCDEFESFSDQELPNLTSLAIMYCWKLRSLPNHMDSLRELWILSCPNLVSFPETGLPPKLTLLYVMSCKNLRQPISEWRLHTLTSLKQLTISNTTDEDCFPDDDGLLLPTSLTLLHIKDQKKLKSISSSIQHLTSLEELWFINCPELHVLPKEGFAAALGHLWILDCPLLGERCLKEEGDYWPIIAHIPGVDVYHTHPQSHANQVDLHQRSMAVGTHLLCYELRRHCVFTISKEQKLALIVRKSEFSSVGAYEVIVTFEMQWQRSEELPKALSKFSINPNSIPYCSSPEGSHPNFLLKYFEFWFGSCGVCAHITQLNLDFKPSVTGLSFSSTEKTIVAAFSEFGKVIEAKIVMDKARNRPKGYGYVTFSKKDDAVKACEGMNGKVIALLLMAPFSKLSNQE